MLPIFGWEVLFYLGGTLPLLLGTVVLIALPESLQFLARRGMSVAHDRIAAKLGIVEPGRTVIADDGGVTLAGAPIRHLFDGGRGSATVLLLRRSLYFCGIPCLPLTLAPAWHLLPPSRDEKDARRIAAPEPCRHRWNMARDSPLIGRQTASRAGRLPRFSPQAWHRSA